MKKENHMFGLGMPEILLILAIALIVIGPKRLPDLAKTLGRAMGEFKRATTDFKNSIDLDTGIDDVRSSSENVRRNIKEANETGKKDNTPDPESDESFEEESEKERPDSEDPKATGKDGSEDHVSAGDSAAAGENKRKDGGRNSGDEGNESGTRAD